MFVCQRIVLLFSSPYVSGLTIFFACSIGLPVELSAASLLSDPLLGCFNKTLRSCISKEFRSSFNVSLAFVKSFSSLFNSFPYVQVHVVFL
eukprot:UN26665